MGPILPYFLGTHVDNSVDYSHKWWISGPFGANCPLLTSGPS